MERGGLLVDSMPFFRRVVGSNPALAATLPVALRSETAVSGAPLSNSGLEEALYRKSLNK